MRGRLGSGAMMHLVLCHSGEGLSSPGPRWHHPQLPVPSARPGSLSGPHCIHPSWIFYREEVSANLWEPNRRVCKRHFAMVQPRVRRLPGRKLNNGWVEVEPGHPGQEQGWARRKAGGSSEAGVGARSLLRKLVSQLSGAAQKWETCASLPRSFPKPMNVRCVPSAEAVPLGLLGGGTQLWGIWCNCCLHQAGAWNPSSSCMDLPAPFLDLFLDQSPGTPVLGRVCPPPCPWNNGSLTRVPWTRGTGSPSHPHCGL